LVKVRFNVWSSLPLPSTFVLPWANQSPTNPNVNYLLNYHVWAIIKWWAGSTHL
jgi:hypothetical protein